jgi:hypothetical protein
MSRTITVADDDTGVTARLVVETEPDGSAGVTELHITATNGHKIRFGDLRLLELVGLQLPAGADRPAVAPKPVSVPATPRPEAPPRASQEAPKKAAKSAPKKATKSAPKKATRRVYRSAPENDTLLLVYVEKKGHIPSVAEHFGVPKSTAYGWYANRPHIKTQGDLAIHQAAKSSDDAEVPQGE